MDKNAQPAVRRLKQGRHLARRLKTLEVASLPPGRHADGDNLYVVVEKNLRRRFVLRCTVSGRRTDLGLGSVEQGLAKAREKAAAMRRDIAAGIDPVKQKRLIVRKRKTFSEVAEEYHSEISSTFRSPKHAAQWLQSLRIHAYPALADKAISEVESADVLRVLNPIWNERSETARRVTQRLRRILNWAAAKGYASKSDAISLALSALAVRSKSTKHFASIPYQDVPQFIRALRRGSASTTAKLGIELILLTVLRTSELTLAQWAEVDWNKRTLTVPRERQRKKRTPTPHVVYLTEHAIQLLTQLKGLADGSKFIFPNRTGDEPVSNMMLLTALKRLGRRETIHGMRASFRTWVDEETKGMGDVAEQILGHVIKDATEAAYRRGNFAAKKRELLQEWERYALTPSQLTDRE